MGRVGEGWGQMGAGHPAKKKCTKHIYVRREVVAGRGTNSPQWFAPRSTHFPVLVRWPATSPRPHPPPHPSLRSWLLETPDAVTWDEAKL